MHFGLASSREYSNYSNKRRLSEEISLLEGDAYFSVDSQWRCAC